MSIQNTPEAGAMARGHTSARNDETDTERDSVRAALERRILGLELCGDDGVREMAFAELARDLLSFAPIHRLIQAEIEKEHARQVGVIRRAAIAANLRARPEFAEIDVAALLTELASAPVGDAEAELREAIAAWRAIESAAPSPSSSRSPTHSAKTVIPGRRRAERGAYRGPMTTDVVDDLGSQPDLKAGGHGSPVRGPASAGPTTGDDGHFFERKETHAQTATVALTRADELKPAEVRWIWDGWLAEGKLHLIAGHPGTGKTTLALSLAAALSRGGAFADGARAPVGSTIVWSGEDDLSDTLIPRFLAAGGDARRLFGVSHVKDARGRAHAFDPARDFPALAATANALTDLKLVIVDPIVLAVRGDSHRNAETRRGLLPLLHLAEKTGAAILGITHFAKRTQGRDPGERVLGSGAFNAMARSVWSTAMPAREGVPFRLVRTKSNLAPQGDGFEYTLVQRAVDGPGKAFAAQAIEWGEPLFGPGAQLIEAIETKPKHDAIPWSEEKEARAWLAETLAQGPVAVTQLARESKDAGFAWRTMERAKKALKIESAKATLSGPFAGWTWVLPKAANGEDEEPDDADDGLVGGLVERLYSKLKDG